jgi:N-formylglutamate amidohydrolase
MQSPMVSGAKAPVTSKQKMSTLCGDFGKRTMKSRSQRTRSGPSQRRDQGHCYRPIPDIPEVVMDTAVDPRHTLSQVDPSASPMISSERASILAELSPPFVVIRPTRQVAPYVWCSPHSGRVYPRAFLDMVRLDPRTLRKSEDGHVDGLVDRVCDLGLPLISARFPRAYLDVNREPYELDPELFEGRLPDYANTQSARVVGGLGTIARIVADGEEIYRRKLPLQSALDRIELLYRPFHAALGALLDETHRTFGAAILIDCHSMPSSLMAQHSGPRPDVVLGDRFGAACHPMLTAFVKDALQRLGYQTQLNRPYAGGFITEHYGRPARGFHALQLEVNRGLYMNETTMEPTRGFGMLRRDIATVAARLINELPTLGAGRAAAE